MNENFLQGIPTQLHFRVTRRGSLYEAQCVELPGIITVTPKGKANQIHLDVEDAIKEYLMALITVTIEDQTGEGNPDVYL